MPSFTSVGAGRPTVISSPPQEAKKPQTEHERKLEQLRALPHPEVSDAADRPYRHLRPLTAEQEEMERRSPVAQHPETNAPLGPRAFWRSEADLRHGVGVRYLKPEERKAYKLKLGPEAGADKTFKWRGKVLDTSSFAECGGAVGGAPSGFAIFVMTAAGKIYIADQRLEVMEGQKEVGPRSGRSDDQYRKALQERASGFHHSSFFAGEPVAAAGELRFDAEGHLTGITDQSGHYRPELRHTLQVLRRFQQLGVNLGGVTMKFAAKKLLPEKIVRADLVLRAPADVADEEAMRKWLDGQAATTSQLFGADLERAKGQGAPAVNKVLSAMKEVGKLGTAPKDLVPWLFAHGAIDSALMVASVTHEDEDEDRLEVLRLLTAHGQGHGGAKEKARRLWTDLINKYGHDPTHKKLFSDVGFWMSRS